MDGDPFPTPHNTLLSLGFTCGHFQKVTSLRVGWKEALGICLLSLYQSGESCPVLPPLVHSLRRLSSRHLGKLLSWATHGLGSDDHLGNVPAGQPGHRVICLPLPDFPRSGVCLQLLARRGLPLRTDQHILGLRSLQGGPARPSGP